MNILGLQPKISFEKEEILLEQKLNEENVLLSDNADYDDYLPDNNISTLQSDPNHFLMEQSIITKLEKSQNLSCYESEIFVESNKILRDKLIENQSLKVNDNLMKLGRINNTKDMCEVSDTTSSSDTNLNIFDRFTIMTTVDVSNSNNSFESPERFAARVSDNFTSLYSSTENKEINSKLSESTNLIGMLHLFVL